MKKKTILGLFLAIAVVFTVSAQQYTEERYFQTEPYGSVVWIIGYTGPRGAVNIPPTISGKRVTSIRNEAFRNKGLTSVIIPDSVQTVGFNAFLDNQLTSVDFGTTLRDLSIPNAGFSNSPITSITISSNATVIFSYTWSSGSQRTNTSKAFDNGFEEYYIAQGSKAGTYTRPNANSTTWTLVKQAPASQQGRPASSYRDSGKNAFDKKNYDRAIADFTEAIRLNPDPYTYQLRADAYMTKKDYDNAIADYTELIRRDMGKNTTGKNYALRAEAYIAKGDYNKAIADYTEAIAKYTNYIRVFNADFYNRRP